MERGKYTVFCTETGGKYIVIYIQCCVLKQERNKAEVIYRVVYINRREI